MNKSLFFLSIFVLFITNTLFSQRTFNPVQENGYNTTQNDTLRNTGEIKVKLSGKTKYTDYKIFSHDRDTTYIDTTLSIQKDYKFNYLRTDNFELLAFHNQGQTFTNLGYDFNNLKLLPDIGFTAKQFSYLDVDEIKYYEVPTPTTEITYRTGLQQGQILDAIFTANFSPRLNVSLSYKGIRSLGAYRRSLASHGNFRGAFHYRTKENQYEIRGHLTSQDFFNEESGGLPQAEIEKFESNDPDYTTRSYLDVNLDDAENNFEGRRLYLEHSYKLISNKDSVHKKDFSNLKVGHVFTTETKEYSFTQPTITTEFFGDSNDSGASNNQAKNTITNNELNLEFNSKYVLGKFKAKVNITNYSYGYDSILNSNSNISKIKLEGSAISVGADWNAKIKNFHLNATGNLSPGSGRLSGNFLQGEALYKKDSVFAIKGSLLISSKSPNFNTLLHQSKYDAYNWYNDFSSVNTRDLGFDLSSKWLNASVNFTNIDNYTYFDADNKPQQFNNQITYLKVKVSREFRYKKFALDNTIMYQNVSSGSSVFRVPELVTRNTFYYQDYWFKGKPMLVNMGATFNYFTKYKMNAYNPLLAEFTLQNDQEIGFPSIDVFFNAQVRRTRLFLKIENVTSSFTEKNYYSAPNYPYRDFTIRFGLVWNWFI
ncbi:putative porin [Polaribacter sp. Z014]|uniref:putative porin n=1 Tax=Polaribacter sp. Z014 TaxID=2927126 RepID=UPI002021936B|nr:putative porin [Polaribacter sp. Z014]MCL7765001.1 putative porin [Polaribacter sp. Z014]